MSPANRAVEIPANRAGEIPAHITAEIPTDCKANSSRKVGFYFDVHGHREGLLPKAMRLVPGNTIPSDVRIADLPATGASGFVLCALGDPNSFLPIKVDPYKSVLRELEAAKKAVAEAKGAVISDPAGLETAAGLGTAAGPQTAAAQRIPAFLLGIEGGDFIGEDPDRIDHVFGLGVRLLGLVHYSKNRIGSISFGWGGKIVPKSERTGLSAFGKTVIARANELGMIIDLAHADDETVRDALAASVAPMICSHTGPRSLQDFPRYLVDELMLEIARAGGLVGLWPFFSGGRGVPDLRTFAEYAAHCAEAIGPEHLAIGSDINGVPGNMAGYRNLFDSPKIITALSERGFSDQEIAGIAGLNFLRFFGTVAG